MKKNNIKVKQWDNKLKYLFIVFWVPIICIGICILFLRPEKKNNPSDQPCWEAIIASSSALEWNHFENDINGLYEEAEVTDISSFFPDKDIQNVALLRNNNDIKLLLGTTDNFYWASLEKEKNGNFIARLDGKNNKIIPLGRLAGNFHVEEESYNTELFIFVILTFFFCLIGNRLAWLNNKGYSEFKYLRNCTGWILAIVIIIFFGFFNGVIDSNLLLPIGVNFLNFVVVISWIISELCILAGLYYYLSRKPDENFEAANNNS